MTPPAFHGLVQHSFALRLEKKRRRFTSPHCFRQIEELFALPAGKGAAFRVRGVGEDRLNDKERMAQIAEHSPLVRSEWTTVHPLSISFSGADGRREPVLPPAFGWALAREGQPDPLQDGPTFVFGKANPSAKAECNDYLVGRSGCESEARWLSWSLLEILAHKRSRLLGLALANRVVTVMLPHAVLTPLAHPQSSATSHGSGGAWFVQPLLSFIRDGQVKTEFRDSYTLTLLLVPIATGYRDRTMTEAEIDWAVNAGWGLAAVPTGDTPPRFKPRGPLLDYLPRLVAPFDPTTLLRSPESDSTSRASVDENSLTLRQGTEVLAFCLALRLARGSTGNGSKEAMRRIGDDVVTALGSARVSSVLVRDDRLTVKDIRREKMKQLKRHRDLMAKISRETRPPNSPDAYGKFRLDRPFVDDNTYVAGVVPTRRCVVVSCAKEAQHGWYQSGLLQAGSIAHMTIGAATAIGTLCAIDRDLEEMEGEDPRTIAAIDGEIATDLREIYDLDITSEAYRRLYRLLRKRLGINRDYKALEEKMLALYRATSTRHEIKSQKQLEWLTVAIVVLSLFILIVGIVTIVVKA